MRKKRKPKFLQKGLTDCVTYAKMIKRSGGYSDKIFKEHYVIPSYMIDGIISMEKSLRKGGFLNNK